LQIEETTIYLQVRKRAEALEEDDEEENYAYKKLQKEKSQISSDMESPQVQQYRP